MRRFTKTTMAVLAIAAGTSAGAIAQKQSVRLDPVSKDLYRLTYFHPGKCNVKVEVSNEHGDKLLSEQINQKKSFTKPYSFVNPKFGEYSFKVTDDEGVFVAKIQRTEVVNLTASIKKLENDKALVIVKGKCIGPVPVRFTDKNDLLVFDDYIDREASFSKVYDLSKVNADELKIEVVAEQTLLATAKF